MKKWSIICIVTILFIVFLILTEPFIKLKGKEKIQVHLNSKWEEPGFSAKTRIQKKNKHVKITGMVNTKKVGTYKIKYQLTSFFNTKTVIRTVQVIETEKPNIILKGEEEVKLCPNEEYKEEGYEVKDNYDKNLKKRVKIERKKDQIIYRVKDSSGNEDIKIRKIKLKNEQGPILSLKGNDTVILRKGQKYQEEGYEAFDPCDQDITSEVVVLGNVNNSKPGQYSLTYIVKNKIGKETRKIRTVIVTDQNNANGGVIYLTFDDGPSSKTTPAILDILKAQNVKVTFFVTDKPDTLNTLIQREHNEGHTVALHTATHNYSYVYSSKEAYFEDLNQISEKVNRLIGKKPNIIRFPGGGSNVVSIRYSKGIMTYLAQEVKKRGYYYYDWNVDSGDATRRYDSDGIYHNVISSLKPGRENIVLMHDFASNDPTTNALERIIQYGKANGYIFAPITEATTEIHHRIAN